MNIPVYNNILNNWDIEFEKKEKKKEILQEWNTLLTPTEKEIIFKICENIHYYSPLRSVSILKKIHEDNVKSENINQTLFLPLKTKNRVESADNLFLRYIEITDLRQVASQNLLTFRSENFIDQFITSINFHLGLQQEFDTLDQIDMIYENHQFYTSTLDKSQRKKVKNGQKTRLRRKTKINSDLQKFWDKKDFTHEVNHIVFIDDFLCSGESLSSFLKSILPTVKTINSLAELCIDFWFLEKYEPAVNDINSIINLFPKNVTIRIISPIESINFMEQSHLAGTTKNNLELTLNSITQKFKIPVQQPEFQQNLGIASFINAPNNNLNFITNKSNSWTPLFPRIKVMKVDKKKKIKDFLLSARRRYTPRG